MITQTTELNLIPNGSPIRIHVDQYDEGVGRLVFRLYEDDVEYSPVGATAVIQGCKPDGRGFEYNCTLSGNTVTADLTRQMTAVNGSVRTQIVVTESDGRIGSFAFIIEVQRSALPSDTDMSESEYQIIEQAILATQDAALDAEAWAVGERGGDPVGPSDPTYHNNAEYWAYMASQYAQGGIIYKGSCLFANIPVSGMNNGDMWNIQDDFTTDARFEEGAGIACVAGTNIVWNGSKWDLFAVPKTGVQSFNGRTGIVTPQAGDYDLTDLGDIVVTSATDGQVLTWDDTLQKWVNSNASGGSASLAGLDDVSLSSPTNGQVLKYNSTTQKWENANESGGGGGDYVGLYGDTLVGSDLNNITSVGNYYNDGTVTVSHYPSNAIITATSSFRLTVEKMGDSASTNLRQTYVLDNSVDFVYERHRTNGSWSSWQKVLTSYSNIGELDNVSISSPTNNQVLTYNSTTQKWENANAQGGSGDYVGLYGMTEIQSSDGQGSTRVDLNDYTTIGNYFCDGKAEVYLMEYGYVGSSQTLGGAKSNAVFLLYVRKISDTMLRQDLYLKSGTSDTRHYHRHATLINSAWSFEYAWHYELETGYKQTSNPGISLRFGSVNDVHINAQDIADNDILVFNSSYYRWENKPLSGYISNPNLLDNPWFTINQRGLTTRSTSGYFVDRWILFQGSVTQNADGTLTLTTTSGKNTQFQNRIDPLASKMLHGQTVTLSAIVGNTLYTKTFVYNDTDSVQYKENIDTNFFMDFRNIPNDGDSGHIIRFCSQSSDVAGDITVKAVKLELGSISTLALDTAPNYATELLKCQRYFVRIQPNSGATKPFLFNSLNDGYVDGDISLAIAMRTNPSVVMSGCTIQRRGQTDIPASHSGHSIANNLLYLYLSATGVTAGDIGYFRIPVSGYVELSADL